MHPKEHGQAVQRIKCCIVFFDFCNAFQVLKHKRYPHISALHTLPQFILHAGFRSELRGHRPCSGSTKIATAALPTDVVDSAGCFCAIEATLNIFIDK